MSLIKLKQGRLDGGAGDSRSKGPGLKPHLDPIRPTSNFQSIYSNIMVNMVIVIIMVDVVIRVRNEMIKSAWV